MDGFPEADSCRMRGNNNPMNSLDTHATIVAGMFGARVYGYGTEEECSQAKIVALACGHTGVRVIHITQVFRHCGFFPAYTKAFWET